LPYAQAEFERARLGQQQSSGSDLAFAEANVRTKQASNDRRARPISPA